MEVTVSQHPIFQREGFDIYSSAPLPFTTAALGGDVRISTVDGDVLYEVKPGTQTDTKVRLRGKQKELIKKLDDLFKGKTEEDAPKEKKKSFFKK